MKKILAIVLALVMALSMIACGASEAPAAPAAPEAAPEAPKAPEAAPEAPAAPEEVTLTFWTPTWRQATEEPIIADFMAKYPHIKIEATYMSSDDIKANTKIAASSNTLPDMWYNWGGVLADFYAENGLCLDLTAYAEANNWNDRFLAGALEQCSYNGQLIGLPQNLIGLVMYYRTDIFEQYNLSVPTTFEELEAVCDTLVANGIIPMSACSSTLMRYHEALLEYYGADEHDALLLLQGNWAESEAVVKSFAKMNEWYEKGYFPKTVLTEDSNSSKALIYSDQAAMIMENPGMASEIVANNYDTNNYSWFAFPNGSGRVSAYAKLCQFNSNISDEKLQAAMLFWDYYYSEESIAAHTNIEQPTATRAVALPETYALADGMLELIDENGSFAVMDLKVPAEVMSQYFAISEAVILGTTTPEAAAAEMQATIDSYLANQ